MQEVGRVIKVSGPLIVAEGMRSCKMFDVVRVGEENLIDRKSTRLNSSHVLESRMPSSA